MVLPAQVPQPIKLLFLLVNTNCTYQQRRSSSVDKMMRQIEVDAAISDMAEIVSKLPAYFGNCSNGKVSVSADYKQFLINMPCTGTYVTPNTSECSSEMRYALVEYVDSMYSRSLLLDTYDHVVYVMWQIDGCPWQGWGNEACSLDLISDNRAYCKMWIKTPLSLQAVLHEWGHNFGLDHASSLDGGEYGDGSCAMGACCVLRCFNAPHSAALGWTGILHSVETPKSGSGCISAIDLPSSGEFLFVPEGSLYVSYRNRDSYNQLSSCETPAVVVHSMPSYTFKTQLLSSVKQFTSVMVPGTNWTLVTRDFGPDRATLVLCYRRQTDHYRIDL